MTATTIEGDKALIRRFSILEERIQKKIVKKALGKSLGVITKAIKGEIPSQWKQIKQLIGGRILKATAGGAVTTIKAGAAVGKKKGGGGERIRLSSGKTLSLKAQRTGRPGVGIGPENVHWFILGTKQRRTWTKRRGRGLSARTFATGGKIRRTGRMPPQVGQPVRRAVAKSYHKAVSVMAEEMRTGINNEVTKLAVRLVFGK